VLWLHLPSPSSAASPSQIPLISQGPPMLSTVAASLAKSPLAPTYLALLAQLVPHLAPAARHSPRTSCAAHFAPHLAVSPRNAAVPTTHRSSSLVNPMSSAPSLNRPALCHLPCLSPASRPLLWPLLVASPRGLSPALPCLAPPHTISKSRLAQSLGNPKPLQHSIVRPSPT
jgi:hypothetical protein